MELKDTWPEIIKSQRLEQNRKKKNRPRRNCKVDFSSRGYTSAERRLLVSSLKEV